MINKETFSFYRNTCDDLEIKTKSKMWKEAYSYLLKRASSLTEVGPNQNVLDIGSGSAKISEFFNKNINYTGVDISPEVIEIARKRYPDRSFVSCNATELSCSDNEFDAVVCVEMLEHLHFYEWRKVLLEIKRVAKPGAKLVFSMPNLYYLWAYIPYSFYPIKRRLTLSNLFEGIKEGASYEKYFTSEAVEAPFHRRIDPVILKSIMSVFFKVDKLETTYWYNNQPIHGLFPKFQMSLLKLGFKSSGDLGSQVIIRCLNK